MKQDKIIFTKVSQEKFFSISIQREWLCQKFVFFFINNKNSFVYFTHYSVLSNIIIIFRFVYDNTQ